MTLDTLWGLLNEECNRTDRFVRFVHPIGRYCDFEPSRP